MGIVLLLWSTGKASDKSSDKSYMNLPVTEDLRPKFVLFSWQPTSGVRRFAVIKSTNGDEEYAFLNHFNAYRTAGLDMAALSSKVARLPPGCLLTWVKDQPHKLDFGDKSNVQTIKALAKRYQIDLHLNVMIHESR